MRTRSRLLLATLIIPMALCSAQEKVVPPTHAPDGGTVERITSIFISPKADAPFTATVNTEWIRHLSDGSQITLVNHRTVARDAKGRVYQERASFVPNYSKLESRVTQIEIADPTANQLYVCRTAESVCHVREFGGLEFSANTAPGKPGTPGLSVESLGTQYISGQETIGTRETRVFAAGSYGNEAPILERKEFWYSPQLGINLMTKREDSRSQQTFEVTNLNLGEPDAKLFRPPAGNRIFDMRNPPEIAPLQGSWPQ